MKERGTRSINNHIENTLGTETINIEIPSIGHAEQIMEKNPNKDILEKYDRLLLLKIALLLI